MANDIHLNLDMTVPELAHTLQSLDPALQHLTIGRYMVRCIHQDEFEQAFTLLCAWMLISHQHATERMGQDFIAFMEARLKNSGYLDA